MRFFFPLLLLVPGWLQAEASWMCAEYSGKGNGTRQISKARPLHWYANSLSSFDGEIKWRAQHEDGWSKIHADVKRIGTWAGQAVVDVLLTNEASGRPFGKFVLIGKAGLFRPVVWLLNDVGVEFSPSRIVTVAGTSVLVSRHRIPGTGNGYLEDYITFDRQNRVPVHLPIATVISAELKRLLPPGRGVWKGGGFDVESLRYRNYVWNDRDANCCPSGGKVDIQLALRDNAITVVNGAYLPEAETSR
jgi:hypothetical protein